MPLPRRCSPLRRRGWPCFRGQASMRIAKHTLPPAISCTAHPQAREEIGSVVACHLQRKVVQSCRRKLTRIPCWERYRCRAVLARPPARIWFGYQRWPDSLDSLPSLQTRCVIGQPPPLGRQAPLQASLDCPMLVKLQQILQVVEHRFRPPLQWFRHGFHCLRCLRGSARGSRPSGVEGPHLLCVTESGAGRVSLWRMSGGSHSQQSWSFVALLQGVHHRYLRSCPSWPRSDFRPSSTARPSWSALMTLTVARDCSRRGDSSKQQKVAAMVWNHLFVLDLDRAPLQPAGDGGSVSLMRQHCHRIHQHGQRRMQMFRMPLPNRSLTMTMIGRVPLQHESVLQCKLERNETHQRTMICTVLRMRMTTWFTKAILPLGCPLMGPRQSVHDLTVRRMLLRRRTRHEVRGGHRWLLRVQALASLLEVSQRHRGWLWSGSRR